MPTLIALAGLPGTGKTSIAQALTRRTGAVLLRIDAIDAAIWQVDPAREGQGESYLIAGAIAVSNLGLGLSVISDCVNPWPVTRDVFQTAATQAGARHLGVELICSDPVEHRRRVQSRISDLPGFRVPSWPEVLARDYLPWGDADLQIDTARTSINDAVTRIAEALR